VLAYLSLNDLRRILENSSMALLPFSRLSAKLILYSLALVILPLYATARKSVGGPKVEMKAV
jgi:hypothetical protein